MMILNHIKDVVAHSPKLKLGMLISVLFSFLLFGCFYEGENDFIDSGCGQSDSTSEDTSTSTNEDEYPSTDGDSSTTTDEETSTTTEEDTSTTTDEDSQTSTEDDSQAFPTTSCAPSSSGSSGEVSEPELQITLPGSWDENWLASPAVADIDNDGVKEIVAARHSVLYVWHADGTLIWKTAFGYSASSSPEHGSCRMWAPPVVGDFDGDQDMEIAVGGDADSSINVNISLYDHQGELLSGWPQRFGDTEVRSLTAADVDGDGIHEIVVNKTSTGPATTVYELDGSMHDNWPQVSNSCDPPSPAEPCWDFGGYNQNIGAADLDGDGIMDVISAYDSIGFGIFDGEGVPFPTASGFSDAVVTAVEAYHDLALSQQGWGTGDRSEFTSSPPVLADIDNDGELEVILAGDHEHSSSTSNQGVTLWVVNADLTRPSGWLWPKDMGAPLAGHGDLGNNIVHTMPNPSTANLDGDAGLEIIVPGYDGVMHAFKPNGEIYWQYTFSETASPYVGASEAVIADLNQDGTPEVIFTTYSSGQSGDPDTSSHLVILTEDGTLLHRVALSGRGSMAPPTIADCDDDGALEIIISLKDSLGDGQSGVQIWNLPGSADNCVLWGTGRGGNFRQGNYLE
ncbi:MAG: VCBS repeat-containing protein [Desulfobacteraceae bacterium]|jgi:hypothetical protein